MSAQVRPSVRFALSGGSITATLRLSIIPASRVFSANLWAYG